MLKSIQIRINGTVQGVGFRPFVYSHACGLDLAGWILNDEGGVDILAQGRADHLDKFLFSLKHQTPPLSRIVSIEFKEVNIDDRLHGFRIRKSRNGNAVKTFCPADAHVCDDCLNEMNDPGNRRFRYPFINCTNCGPRYSIIYGLPYDRDITSMAGFSMCPDCRNEYENPLDRRYHAQPTACPVCGPQLTLYDGSGNTLDVPDIITYVANELEKGAIAAVKGIGGFHLCVNAFDDRAVLELRKRKKRDWKAFALMARDIGTIEHFAWVHPEERRRLEESARPIVLLRRKELKGGSATHHRISSYVAPYNPSFGFMLPSAPLHYLLLEKETLPVLVMTSGNISGYPICTTNEDALEQLGQICDFILTHDRDIVTRVDDSVLRVSVHPELPEPVTTFIRRSRGYAPHPVLVSGLEGSLVGLGAELKTTVAVSSGPRVFLSQHIGDLKNHQTFESHGDAVRHMCMLNRVTPGMAACDLHPSFRSSLAADTFAERVISVQHHHAHMAACLAENTITEKSIGVIFDGAGFGNDGKIWGGEFLVGDASSFQRVAKLRNIPLLGGDAAVREPARIALALLVGSGLDVLSDPTVKHLPCVRYFSREQVMFFSKMIEKRLNCPEASSMGRFFDGIASLCGLCQKAEYEAHAPIRLEGLLNRDFSEAEPFGYGIEAGKDGLLEIDYRVMVREMVQEINRGETSSAISRRFHQSIVRIILDTCIRLNSETGLSSVVLSGGVFLNEFLTINTMIALRKKGFRVGVHRDVPPNDGCISLGQIVVADAQSKENITNAKSPKPDLAYT